MASKYSSVNQFWSRYKKNIQCLSSYSNNTFYKDASLSKVFSFSMQNTPAFILKIKNRCVFSNRSRAVFNKLKLTRMVFKNLALHGLLNGIKKQTW